MTQHPKHSHVNLPHPNLPTHKPHSSHVTQAEIAAAVAKSQPPLHLAPFADRLAQALADLRNGRPVFVADAADREGEVDAVLAANRATEKWIAWLVRHSSGFVCAPMPISLADKLELPLMVPDNEERFRTAYTVSVDATEGVTTGISAADRARTLRVLGDPTTTPADLVRPGHVLPLRAHPKGVLGRPGHTEAAVDLVQLAGAGEVGVIAELLHFDGRLLTFTEAADIARQSGLVYLSIEELKEYLATR